MSVLFYIPPDSNTSERWDGERIRNGNLGSSGTHQSFVLVAEQVARQSNVPVYMFNFCTNRTFNGVLYIDDLLKLSNQSNVKTIVIPPWVSDFRFISMFSHSLKNIIVWFHYHSLPYALARFLYETAPTVKISFVHVSNWSQDVINRALPPEIAQRITHHFCIPNPLMCDIIPAYNEHPRPNNASFMACYERGGEMALRIWNLLKSESSSWGQFISKFYGDKSQQCDKKTLFEMNNNTIRYFVYPLVLPGNNPQSFSVHRDTFACCVAEALACGVEVLSYPVAALPEHYKDMVHWIPLPDGITKSDIDSPVHDPRLPGMFSESQVKVIANILHDLDKTYLSRAQRRAEIAKEIASLYNPIRIGKMWMEALSTSGAL